MVKKWYGIEKIIDREIEVPKKLHKYQELMQEIPNFDKTIEGNVKRNKNKKVKKWISKK